MNKKAWFGLSMLAIIGILIGVNYGIVTELIYCSTVIGIVGLGKILSWN